MSPPEVHHAERILFAGAQALVIAFVATPLIRDLAKRFGLVDVPGGRKQHARAVPRVGGVAIALAYLATALGLVAGSEPNAAVREAALRLLPGLLVILVVGIVDDVRSLRPAVKLAGQLTAALAAYASGVRIETIGQTTVADWLGIPLTVFCLLLTTNALNLIDGLDGLCAGIGLVATMTIFGAALVYGNTPLMAATLPLAGALAGFLFYNFAPASIFLGDSGAMMTGYLLGCFGLMWTQKTATMISLSVPLLALTVPLFDLLFSILRRALAGRPIFHADRGHVHHRLLDRGLTPRDAVLVLYGVSGAGSMVALALSDNPAARPAGFLLIGYLGVMAFAIRKLRYRELSRTALRQAAADLLSPHRWRNVLRPALSRTATTPVTRQSPAPTV